MGQFGSDAYLHILHTQGSYNNSFLHGLALHTLRNVSFLFGQLNKDYGI